MDVEGVFFAYIRDDAPNCWGVPFSKTEFHPELFPLPPIGAFHALEFNELFPLDKEFASKNVGPEKQEAYESYQQAFGQLTDDVISATVKLGMDTKEKDLNVKIAKNIFVPLLGQNGYCLMNKDHKFKGVAGLKTPDDCKVDGLWIGYEGALFGEPDWFVCPRDSEDCCVAGIGAIEAEPKDDDDDDDNEPVAKRRKGSGDSPGNSAAEEASGSNKLSPGKNVAVEGKKGTGMSSTSQAIATCIAFSFVYHSRHPDLTFIPTILVSNEGFVVFLYNSKKDVLLKCGLPWKQEYLLVLWAVLNHRLFLNSAKVNEQLKFGYHQREGRYTLKNIAPRDMRYMAHHLQRPLSAFQQLLHADTVALRCGQWKL